MKNIVLKFGVILLLVLGSFNRAGQRKYQLRTLVIDAGHGGHDYGASGKVSHEKDVALAIALELGSMIKKQMKGVKVIYTRKTDKFVTLFERAKIANNNNADVLISIHCNSAPQKEMSYGTETYTMGLHRSDSNLRVAKRENSVILMEKDYQKNYNGFDPKLPESHILLALYQSAYIKNSLMLAQHIQDQFKNKVGRVSRGVKQAGLLVLYKTAAPSVLVEVGFITHPKEEPFLNSTKGRKSITKGIYNALTDYKKQLERNT